jgi:hypothetical protein
VNSKSLAIGGTAAIAIFMAACNGKVDAVSGDSFCKDYIESNVTALRKKGDLASAVPKRHVRRM